MEPKTGEVLNEFAQYLNVASKNNSERYDAAARSLISQKSVLAYVLKSSLKEYAPYPVQEIAKKYIVGTPEVRKLAVDQDHPDRETVSENEMMSGDEKVEGVPTVDKSQREGTVYYDIRFIAILPKTGEFIQIFVNFEIQLNDTPGYPVPKRGIYYVARMISAQRGTVFKDQEYGKIKKCVSIWICEDTSNARSDTINRYSFTEECVRGNYHEPQENYDLMEVVILRLGSKGTKSQDNAIRLLSILFDTGLVYDEKIDKLEKEFLISSTKDINKEVREMCNLSTGLINKGEAKGIAKGEARGMAKVYYTEMHLPISDIAQRLSISTNDVEDLLSSQGLLPNPT